MMLPGSAFVTAASAALCCRAVSLTGCGYHVSGHSDLLPTQYQDDRDSRVRQHHRPVSADGPDAARLDAGVHQPDAVSGGCGREAGRCRAEGRGRELPVFPDVVDQVTGRVGRRSGAGGAATESVRAGDREGASIRARAWKFAIGTRSRSIPQAYFEESDLALERVSRDVARTVVSSVLEAF